MTQNPNEPIAHYLARAIATKNQDEIARALERWSNEVATRDHMLGRALTVLGELGETLVSASREDVNATTLALGSVSALVAQLRAFKVGEYDPITNVFTTPDAKSKTDPAPADATTEVQP